MTKRFVSVALAAALAGTFLVPGSARANTAASVRNALVAGLASAGAAIGITNYNHKKHLRQQELQDSARRQASYKDYFLRKYGYNPTPQQVHEWYVRAYGVEPV